MFVRAPQGSSLPCTDGGPGGEWALLLSHLCSSHMGRAEQSREERVEKWDEEGWSMVFAGRTSAVRMGERTVGSGAQESSAALGQWVWAGFHLSPHISRLRCFWTIPISEESLWQGVRGTVQSYRKIPTEIPGCQHGQQEREAHAESRAPSTQTQTQPSHAQLFWS